MVTTGISLFTKAIVLTREAARSSVVSSKERTSLCSHRPASLTASIHPYCSALLENVTMTL